MMAGKLISFLLVPLCNGFLVQSPRSNNVVMNNMRLMTVMKSTSADTTDASTVTEASTNRLDMNRQTFAKTLLAASTFPFLALPANAAKLEDSLRSIVAVRDTTAQLEELVNNGEFEDVPKNIQVLIKNYQLPKKITEGAQSINDKKARAEAEKHGREAYEFLQQINEYFPKSMDNMTGTQKIKQSPEYLQFTVKALQKARSELNLYLAAFPADDVKAAEDFNGSSS